MIPESKPAAIGASVASFLTCAAAYGLWKYLRSQTSDLVPVGIIKELFIYPVKSCKGISVFSFFCDKYGAVSGENRDRQFVVIDGKSGRFYSGREKPQMVTIECEVHDGILEVRTRDGSILHVDIEKVREKKVVRRAREVDNMEIHFFLDATKLFMNVLPYRCDSA